MFDSRATNRPPLPSAWIGAGAAILAGWLTVAAVACPFCRAVRATLAQQRDASAVVVLVEATDKATDKASETAGGKSDSSATRRQSFRIHAVLKGKKRLGEAESLRVAADAPIKEGSLGMLLASGADDASVQDLQWTAIPLDESAYAYVFREPALSAPIPSGSSILPDFSSIAIHWWPTTRCRNLPMLRSTTRFRRRTIWT